MYITCKWWTRNGISTEDPTVNTIKGGNLSSSGKQIYYILNLTFVSVYLINQGLCWFGNFFWPKIKWTFVTISVWFGEMCIWQPAVLRGTVPPAAEGVRRPERCQIRNRSVSWHVQDESTTTGERGTVKRSAVIETWKSGTVSSLKTNLFNNDLLTSFWTPTLPPNIIVIIIIIFGTGCFETCFCLLYVLSLLLHCHVFSYFLSPWTLMKFEMQESVYAQ